MVSLERLEKFIPVSITVRLLGFAPDTSLNSSKNFSGKSRKGIDVKYRTYVMTAKLRHSKQ
jgi:hypothetical protein